METKTKKDEYRIPWHPAFVEALQMELEDYRDVLEFLPEYQLTSEPLRIDCVVVKKTKNAVIRKNIAAIFREWNLLEYKSPGSYVSVGDFYKVYGYACLYATINKIPMTSLTVSFIESRYPRKLLEHLRRERGYTVEKTGTGIYTVSGDILPIQIINSRKLSEKENLWLKSLNKEHDGLTIDRLDDEIHKRGKTSRLRAYLYAIIWANPGAAEEAIMRNKFNEVMERTGLAAEWEARGRDKYRTEVARNALAKGVSPDLVREITGLPMETIANLKK